MKKIKKLFYTSLILFVQGMCTVLGVSGSEFSDVTPETRVEQVENVQSEKNSEENLAGTYVGSYTDYSRVHGVTLKISEENGNYKAVFSFYPISYSESTQSGSFSMNVHKNHDGTYNFVQDKWISQPFGYEMVDILNCNLSNFSIKGDVCVNSDGCLVQIGNLFVTNTHDTYVEVVKNEHKFQAKLQILMAIALFGSIFLGVCGFVISVYLLCKKNKSKNNS